MDIYAILAILGTGIGIVTLNYRFMRNFKNDMNKIFERFEERAERRFEQMERRFEQMDERLFLLCMGKSLPDILKAEREEKR